MSKIFRPMYDGVSRTDLKSRCHGVWQKNFNWWEVKYHATKPSHDGPRWFLLMVFRYLHYRGGSAPTKVNKRYRKAEERFMNAHYAQKSRHLSTRFANKYTAHSYN